MKERKELWRTVKFALFSASAGIIQAGSFAALDLLTNLSYMPCYLISLVLSVLWNFTLNRNFTFRSAGNVPVAMLKVAAYYLVFTPVTTVGGGWLVDSMHWNEYLVTGMNRALNFVTEYLYDRFFVFRATLDTKKGKNGENSGKKA